MWFSQVPLHNSVNPVRIRAAGHSIPLGPFLHTTNADTTSTGKKEESDATPSSWVGGRVKWVLNTHGSPRPSQPASAGLQAMPGLPGEHLTPGARLPLQPLILPFVPAHNDADLWQFKSLLLKNGAR